MTVARLPVANRRHKWDLHSIKNIPACEAPDGNDRTERICIFCQMRKITVHGANGLPWLEFWNAKGARVWAQRTPPCEGARE